MGDDNLFAEVTEKKGVSPHTILGLLAGILIIVATGWLALTAEKNQTPDQKTPPAATAPAK